MHRHPHHKLVSNHSQPIFSFSQIPYNNLAPITDSFVETKQEKPQEIQRIERDMERDRNKILSITDPIADALVNTAPFFGPAAGVLGSLAYGAYNYLK